MAHEDKRRSPGAGSIRRVARQEPGTPGSGWCRPCCQSMISIGSTTRKNSPCGPPPTSRCG